MPNHQHTDVVIAGAGFAGLACARSLAQQGLSVSVLERKQDVGEGVHTTGILVKEAAEAYAFPASVLRKVPKVRLYAPNFSSVDLESEGYYFLATDTPNLLRYMATQAEDAGVKILYNTPYQEGAVEKSDSVYLPWLYLRCDYLIGADGAKSKVAEDFTLGKNNSFLVGVELEYQGISGIDEEYLHCFMDAELARGYLAWVVPGTPNIQIGLACRPPQKPDIDAFIERLQRVFDFTNAKVVARRGGLIPVGGTVSPLATKRVLLLGDSAGIVSPLTAGGIYTSLHYGEVLARAIAENILEGGPEPAGVIHREYPRFYSKSLLRLALDYTPPNWVLDATMGNPLFCAVAQTVFFHHRGLLSPRAWKEMLAEASARV